MSEYLGRAFDRDLTRIAWMIVVLVGAAVLGSIAVGYLIGRASCAQVAAKEESK